MNKVQPGYAIVLCLSLVMGCFSPDTQSQQVEQEVSQAQTQATAARDDNSILVAEPQPVPVKVDAEVVPVHYPSTDGQRWGPSQLTAKKKPIADSVPIDASQYPSTNGQRWEPNSQAIRLAKKSAADSALLDAARALRTDGRYEEAIAVLGMLLAGPEADDSLCSLYRHHACLELSEIHHEQLHDLQSALEFAILARDKYRVAGLCGLGAMWQRQELDERIALLTQQLSETSAPKR